MTVVMVLIVVASLGGAVVVQPLIIRVERVMP